MDDAHTFRDKAAAPAENVSTIHALAYLVAFLSVGTGGTESMLSTKNDGLVLRHVIAPAIPEAEQWTCKRLDHDV